MEETTSALKGLSNGLPPRPPDILCNARLKSRRGYCVRTAGKGTNHQGEGRCYVHGGRAGAPDRYGIAKNRTNSRLEAHVEYYVKGEGRAQLHDIDLQLARFNALWATLSADDAGTKDATLIRLVSDNSKALLRYQQLQLEGALRLDEWNDLTERMRATFKRATSDWLVRHVGYSRQEAHVAAEEIETLAREKWETK